MYGMHEVLDFITNEAPDSCVGSAASVEAISEVSDRLSVELPKSYRQFLGCLGYALWPEWIYGICEGDFPGGNVAWQTEIERRFCFPPMPPYLVPISPDGWGNHLALDTRAFFGDECAVVFWDHELPGGQELEVVSCSFLEWIKDLISMADGETEMDDSGQAALEIGRRVPKNEDGIVYRPPYRGASPLDRDKNPIEHHQQFQDSKCPVDEMTRREHRYRDVYSKNHPRSLPVR